MGNLMCCIQESAASNDKQEEATPVTDRSANGLSYVGEACYQLLRTKHAKYHDSLWNVTKSKVVGSLQHTPGKSVFSSEHDPEEGHSNWFAEKMCEIMSKTTVWCDVMSLAAPDGYFLEQFQKALKTIADNNKDNSKPVIVRLMFGNIIALPINCQRLMRRLTADLPKDANIQLWVGAWRRGASWNHAKIIAADGKYLQTGGHNVWSDIYLKEDPIHDVSIEMEGSVAHDAHLFANSQWQFIEKKQASLLGQILENVPDFIPLASKNRVIVSEYPQGKASEFAPLYDRSLVPVYDSVSDAVATISIGRQGVLIEDDRPADDAFIAMMDASKRIIRMSLQDLGPVTFPGVKIPLPSVGWPKPYFDALARAIWLRGVDVEIVLSNENAKSGYTNGWSCVDVASEIIKRITKQFPDAPDADLRQKVEDNLRICYIRHSRNMDYKSGTRIGNHTKFFIVDDLVSYTGSQNLYEADLAEWGVIVDDTEQTAQMMEDYWTPLWEASYFESDCEVQDVMDGLKIDRDGAGAGDPNTAIGKRNAEAAAFAMTKAQFPEKAEFNDEDPIALDKSVVFDA